ncbi:MAG: hypothetical protein CMF46_03665 [Legionellales bacterium]|nr:hypothetical protein [Legionellales bacterium]
MMMKYYLSLISLLLFVTSCITQPKSKVESITGEFLFYDNAAVLNTGNEIYGVIVDEKLHELHAQALNVQKDSFDMVQVFIKGVIFENPNEEGWPQVVTVKEIDSVAPSLPFSNQMIEIRTE